MGILDECGSIVETPFFGAWSKSRIKTFLEDIFRVSESAAWRVYKA